MGFFQEKIPVKVFVLLTDENMVSSKAAPISYCARALIAPELSSILHVYTVLLYLLFA